MNFEKLYIIGFSILNLVIYSQSVYRLPNYFKPTHYKILLDPNLAEGTFEGEVNVKFEILNATNKIELHATNMELHHLETIITIESSEIEPISLLLEDELLIINFDDNLHPGQYGMILKYIGYLNDERRGFYRDFYLNDRKEKVFFAATYFQPTHARQVFPCWDEPALKAKFSISIRHHPNYTAVSNMPILNKTENLMSDGKILTNFEETPLLSTYSLALTISDFIKISSQKLNFSIWSRENAIKFANRKFAYNLVLKVMKAFQGVIGVPYSIPKTDIFLVPGYERAGTAHLGLIIVQEKFFLIEDKSTDLELSSTISRHVTYQIIYQCLGNWISPAWWSDIWIMEGLTNYMEQIVLNGIKLKNVSLTLPEYFYETRSISLKCDEETNCPLPYRNPNSTRNIFNRITRKRTSVVFKMLSSTISEAIFKKAIQLLIKKYQFSTLSTNEFFKTMQTTIRAMSKIRNPLNVENFMKPYIFQRGYPVVYLTRINGTRIVKLTQKCSMCSKNETVNKWSLLITFMTNSSLNFENIYENRWFDSSSRDMLISNIDPKNWIILNIHAYGYYRVHYDDVTWNQIIDYLHSKDYAKIPLFNRIQILDDAGWLYRKKLLSKTKIYQLLSYLEVEENYKVWNQASKIVISIMLEIDSKIMHTYLKLINGVKDKIKTEKGNVMGFALEKDRKLVIHCSENMESCKKMGYLKNVQ